MTSSDQLLFPSCPCVPIPTYSVKCELPSLGRGSRPSGPRSYRIHSALSSTVPGASQLGSIRAPRYPVSLNRNPNLHQDGSTRRSQQRVWFMLVSSSTKREYPGLLRNQTSIFTYVQYL